MATAAFGAVAHPITYWIVTKFTTQTGLPTPFYSTIAGPQVGDAIYAPDGTHVNLYGETLALNATFNMTAGFATYVAICNGAGSSLRINGTQVAAGTIGSANNITGFTVGSVQPVGTQYIDGDVAEVGFTAQALSGTKLAQLENYLRRRYRTW
jgi:hypothetical protein